MELKELEERLVPFCQSQYATCELEVFDVVQMPGHAGFAYGFRVNTEAVGTQPAVGTAAGTDSWFIRLPPPNVNWRGTADVLRQVEVLNALDGTGIPHCSVQWSGADLEWFDCPYFVVPWLEGDVLRLAEGEWGAALDSAQLLELGRQAMSALAAVHKLDPATVPYLGDAVLFAEDVVRWDRLFERAADPERLRDAPVVRQKLLDRLPADAPIGIFHGDFQTANLFCSPGGELRAVIDWELTGIGATLNDLGWITTFSDPEAWDHSTDTPRSMFLDPKTLIDLYTDAYGSALPDLNWFRALAAYKFAIITGFNLGLHRRGKRHDPTWEISKLSMTSLINRANELLG